MPIEFVINLRLLKLLQTTKGTKGERRIKTGIEKRRRMLKGMLSLEKMNQGKNSSERAPSEFHFNINNCM